MLPSGPEVNLETLKSWWQFSKPGILPLLTVVAAALLSGFGGQLYTVATKPAASGLALDSFLASMTLLVLGVTLLVCIGVWLLKLKFIAFERRVMTSECRAAREELFLIQRWLPDPALPQAMDLRQVVREVTSQALMKLRDIDRFSFLRRDGVYLGRGHWGRDWPADRLPHNVITSFSLNHEGLLSLHEHRLRYGNRMAYIMQLEDRELIAAKAYAIWLEANQQIDTRLENWRTALLSEVLKSACALRNAEDSPGHVVNVVNVIDRGLDNAREDLLSAHWRTSHGELICCRVLEARAALQGFLKVDDEDPPSEDVSPPSAPPVAEPESPQVSEPA